MTWEKDVRQLSSLLRVLDSLLRLGDLVASKKEAHSDAQKRKPQGELGERQERVHLVQGEDNVWREEKVAGEGE